MVIRGQLMEAGSPLLPRRSWGLDLENQTWQKVSLSSEPSRWLWCYSHGHTHFKPAAYSLTLLGQGIVYEATCL